MRLVDADELIEHAWREKLDSRELIVQMIKTAPTIKEIPTKIPIHIYERLLKLSESERIEGDAISRAEALEKINSTVLCTTNEARIIIKNLPSIHPKAKVGHWILDTKNEVTEIYKCSECGRLISLLSVDNKTLKDFPYCHCGAKMEKEKVDKEQVKSAMEGLTSFMRAICNNDNLGVPKEMADEFGISEEYRRNEE